MIWGGGHGSRRRSDVNNQILSTKHFVKLEGCMGKNGRGKKLSSLKPETPRPSNLSGNTHERNESGRFPSSEKCTQHASRENFGSGSSHCFPSCPLVFLHVASPSKSFNYSTRAPFRKMPFPSIFPKKVRPLSHTALELDRVFRSVRFLSFFPSCPVIGE